jgi:hypothetical protein
MDLIRDIRKEDQFKLTTFSKYQRVAVKKELLTALSKGKLEPCCYWTIEMICSGLFMDLWELILQFYAKHIHVANPKLPIYIEMRFSTFKQIVDVSTTPELDMRNNIDIRKLFTEIITILCLSNKHHSYDKIHVNQDDFNILTERLKAPHIQFIDPYFKQGDPKELFIPLNEFSYMLDQKNTVGACYWIEWMLHFINKKSCACIPRDFPKPKDPIWIIWEILLGIKNPLLQKIMKSLVKLFCIKYTPAAKDRRRFLLYYAVSLHCETINTEIDIIANKPIIDSIYDKTSFMYKNIKKHEVN